MRSFCKSAVWSLKHWSSTKLALHSAKFPFRDGEPGMAFSKHGFAVIQDSSYTKLVTNCSFWVYNSKGISELKVLKSQGSKAAHATDSKRNFWHSFLQPSHSSPDFLGGKKWLRYRIFWRLLAHRLTRLSMGYKHLTRRSRLMLELWTPYELRWTEMERGIWGLFFNGWYQSWLADEGPQHGSCPGLPELHWLLAFRRPSLKQTNCEQGRNDFFQM